MWRKLVLNNDLEITAGEMSGRLVACKLLLSRWNQFCRDESVLMNAFPVPFRHIAIAVLTCVLVTVGVLNLRDRIHWTSPTDGVFWSESGGVLIAEAVEAGGPGSIAGLEEGERLLAINGIEVTNLGVYADALFASEPGEPLAYTVEGRQGMRHLILVPESKSSLTARDGLRTLLAFLYLGIGVAVAFRGGRLPRTFHFYLICLAAFVVYLFSYTPRMSVLDWWVYGLSVVAFLVLPALFVHFCLRFPADVISGGRHIPLLYFPGFLLLMLHFGIFTGRLAPFGLPRTARSLGIIDNIELIYFIAGFLVGGGLLLKRRIETQDLVERQQMKWVSYGTLAGVGPFALIYVVPVLLGARSSLVIEWSMLFLGLIPLSIGYALIHYRLMDVEVIARRSAAYFISSSLLLAVYLGFVLVLGRALQFIAPQAGYMGISISVLLIALLFAPLRNRVQKWLDRLFYKEQFEARATLLDFARTLSAEISLGPLSRTIVERVLKTFRVEHAAIFLTDQAHPGFFRMVYGSDPGLASRLYRQDELAGETEKTDLSELKAGPDHLHAAGPGLIARGLHYLQDLRVHGRQVGVIALGQLPGGSHFSSEDLDLLSALARYAAIALENAGLYRSIESKALELERIKTYTENILESINVAVLALDSSGRITSCNRAFEQLYQSSRSRIVGSFIENLFPGDVVASIEGAAGTKEWALRSPANIYKLYLENHAGKRLIVNLSLIPLQQDAAEGCLMVLDDITEKLRMEDQLLQAEKLSSIGLLAAGIAHEVNTPIAGISSYTQMLLKQTPETDRRKQILEKIEKQTFRAAEIVNGLLSFSRMNGSEFKNVDINQLIHESLTLLDHQLSSSHITVESRYDESLPPVYGNAGKLQQVFLNILLNAKDAMPSGGELGIRTAMNDSMVIIDVTDTGTGISQENLSRIFDPFFTTKAIGKGTGLGLAVSYGIIQEHGGRIFVDSDSGKGTRFTVKLPTRLN